MTKGFSEDMNEHMNEAIGEAAGEAVCEGIIVKALSGFYYVQEADGLLACRGRGRLRKEGVSPMVGDRVRYTRSGESGSIDAVLPRRNSFIRPQVANVDLLVVFAAAVNPVTDPFLIDQVMAIAASRDVESLLVINKCDCDRGEALAEIYRNAGIPVLQTSAVTGEGIDALREALRGKTAALTGNSGVGKSSILNALEPGFSIPTGEVSEKLGRGRHTTRHVELYRVGDARVMDTPGFSAFDTEQMDLIYKEKIQDYFIEFRPLIGRCRFPDCAHLNEPDCAVREALAQGRLMQSRYDSYRRLYESASRIHIWEREKTE